VESAITVPHWDGDQDVLWLVVRRTINGASVRYVEYIEKYLADEYAFFVDSGLTYDGSPTTTITGLSHLEGKEVAVLVDGAVHPNRTVASGSITLQLAGSVVNVGLAYTSTIKTMPIDVPTNAGTSFIIERRIDKIVMQLHETGPGLWYGSTAAEMDEYSVRSSLDDMDSPVTLFTGFTDALAWPSSSERGPQLMIQHRLPLPCTVVALIPEL
jgi:hypothetical protein